MLKITHLQNEMSISGTRTVVSTQQVEARRLIQLSDKESIKVSINQDEAKFNIPILVNEILPSTNNEVFLNANSIKTKYGTGYLKSNEHGVITSTNPTAADIILPHKNMLVGNTSGIAKTSSVIQC